MILQDATEGGGGYSTGLFVWVVSRLDGDRPMSPQNLATPIGANPERARKSETEEVRG